ncbi:MAG: condensation domain-containing protein, partial [Myxococcota bacterium]
MNGMDLINRLRGLGVKLWLDGEKLRFTAPRGALTPELRDEMKARKSELRQFLAWAQGQMTRDREQPVIPPAPRTDPIPLSSAQERLWFIDQLQPNTVAYHVPTGLRLLGPLDVAVLDQCFATLVARHESLRTVFPALRGKPRQQLLSAPQSWTSAIHDLSSLDDEQSLSAIRTQLQQLVAQPFDLECGPLLRTTLLHVADDEHILLITMHHIITDGWSMGVMVRELSQLYSALVRGQPSPIPALSLQYPDFAVWQREKLRGQRLDSLLAYWRDQLSGVEALRLPTDHPRPAVLSNSGGAVPLRLSRQLTDTLKTVSRDCDATPFMTLLAAFHILLSRYSDQRDLCIGTPIANRNHADLESLIGFFVNTLVIRNVLVEHESFSEFVARVRNTTLGAYDHQDLPFEQLVASLLDKRNLDRNPLFQVSFALQNAPTRRIEQAGLTIEVL